MKRKTISYLLGAFLFFFLLSAQFDSGGMQDQQAAVRSEQADDGHAAADGDDEHGDTGHHGEEGFNPSHFIFDHILDAYEWHILTYGDFHLSIPLPVILFSETRGLNIFLFSKFHHGHSGYKGFRYMTSGEHRGSIMEVMEDGSLVPPGLDLSITKNVVAIFISIILLCWIFISVAKAYRERPGKAPRGLQNMVEPLILFVRDEIARASIGHKYERFVPFLLSVFFFILLNNLMGLIPIFPGGANVTGNITVTMILALFTFFITLINGNRNYWQHVFNMPGVPWWVKIPIPLMPVIEIIGMFTKPFVLMVRLFANIAAGHIIVLGFFSLIFIFGEMNAGLGFGISLLSLAFTIFMTMLELLVALIQAYVFTLLSAIYFGIAVEEHH